VFIYEYVLVNKKLLCACLVLVYLLTPSPVSAADTCCLDHGGDYACDYSTSQLYCKDGTVSTQCSCQAAPTATPVPTAIPTDTPVPVSPAPSCPVNASFRASGNSCTCNAGFVVSNNACVSYLAYCQAQYGNNSLYNSATNACACASGYTWNAAGSACETMDALCTEKIGSKSYFNSSDNNCYCYSGYAIQNGQCQLLPTPEPPATIAPTKGIPLVPPTPVVIPTLAGVIIPTHAPVKKPVKKQAVKFDPNKKVPGLNSFVAVKKKQSGFLETILSAILGALLKAFNI
jgi:hypothetical protein